MAKTLLPVSVGISNAFGHSWKRRDKETDRRRARNKLREEVWIPPVLLICQDSVRLPTQQCYLQYQYLCSVSKAEDW